MFLRSVIRIVVTVLLAAVGIRTSLFAQASAALEPNMIYFTYGPTGWNGRGITIVQQLAKIKPDGTGLATVVSLPPPIRYAIPNPVNPTEWIFSYAHGDVSWISECGIYRITGNLPANEDELKKATLIRDHITQLYKFVVSPDGQYVYFSGYNNDGANGQLFNGLCRTPMNPANGPVIIVDDQTGYFFALNDAGTKLAMNRSLDGDIYTKNVDGTGLVDLGPLGHGTGDPDAYWNHAGDRIAIGTIGGLYSCNTSGGEVIQLTSSSKSCTFAAFSPDDKKVAYVRRLWNGTPPELWICNADGTGQQMIFQGQMNSTIDDLIWVAPKKGIASITLQPTALIGGASSQGTITMKSAPDVATTINLSSSESAATVPATVTVPAGATTATFTVSTSLVSSTKSVTISATASGLGSATANLTVNPIIVSGLTLAKSTITGGDTTTATVTLNANAPVGGATVSISSNNPALSTPTTAIVPAGTNMVNFPISTINPATDQSAAVSATCNDAGQWAAATIKAQSIINVSVAPVSVISEAGTVVTGHVEMANPSSSATVLALTVDNAVVAIPASVTIPAGQSMANFTVSYGKVSATAYVTITAKWTTFSKFTYLKIEPLSLTSIAVSPSTLPGGTSSTGTVTLNSIAGASGVTVKLTSSNASVLTVPASVTIAKGKNAATFPITTKSVTANTAVDLSANVGSVTKKVSVTLTAPTLTAFSVTPSIIGGTDKLSGTVTISANASGAGYKVKVSSSNSAAVTPPSTVTIPSGKNSFTFPIPFKATANYVVTLSASANDATLTATVNVIASVLKSVTVAPASVFGGANSIGTVTLAANATGEGQTVMLTSADPAVTVPQTITVPSGSKSATFEIHTNSVTTVKKITITGKSGASATAKLEVKPTTIKEVVVDPTTVVGGSQTTVTGLVRLEGPAPSGGVVVKLKSSLTSVVTTPASVTIPAGAVSTTFAITHKSVTKSTPTTLTGTLGSVNKTTILTVKPKT